MADKPIRKTTGKGGNYRKTKAGAGMTKKGVAAHRRLILVQNLKLPLRARLKKEAPPRSVVSLIAHDQRVR